MESIVIWVIQLIIESHHSRSPQMMFDYRRRAIQLSEELFCSILERFKKKVGKLEYPEYSSYTKQMYRKYDQIMDQLDKLFQKVEAANDAISEAQKNQLLFLQLMKFSQEAKNYSEVDQIIRGTNELGPIEQYLLKFYKLYFNNRDTIKAIEKIVGPGEENADLAARVEALGRDLNTANTLLSEKESESLELKANMEKMAAIVSDKIQEYGCIFSQNLVLNAEIERLREVNSKEKESSSALATLKMSLEQQLQQTQSLSAQQNHSIQEAWKLNSELNRDNNKISYENQMMDQAINRLNQKMKELSDQLESNRTFKFTLEVENQQKEERIVVLSKRVLAMSNECGNVYDKNQELSEKNQRYQTLVDTQNKEKSELSQQVDAVRHEMVLLQTEYEEKCWQLKVVGNLNDNLEEQKAHMAGIIQNVDKFVIQKAAEKDQLLAKNEEFRGQIHTLAATTKRQNSEIEALTTGNRRQNEENEILLLTTKRQNEEIDKFFVNNNELGAEIYRLKELIRKLTEEKDQIPRLQHCISRLTEQLYSVKQLTETLRRQKDETLSMKQALEELRDHLLERMSVQGEEHRRLCEHQNHQIDRLTTENREVGGNLAMLKKLFQIQKSEYVALMDIESALQHKNKHYKSKIDSLQAELTKRGCELDQSFLNTSQLQKEHANLQEKLSNAQKQLEQTECAHSRCQADLNSLKEQNARMVQHVKHENKELDNLKQDYWALTNQYNTMKDNHNLTIRNFSEQISRITQEHDALTRDCNENETYLYEKISNLNEHHSKSLEKIHHLENELYEKVNWINQFQKEQSLQQAKIQEIETQLRVTTDSMSKFKRRLDKYEPAEESWIIMGEETTEIVIEETV